MPHRSVQLAYERAAVQAESLDPAFDRACRIAALGTGASTAVLWTRYGEIAQRTVHGSRTGSPGARLSDAIARGVIETDLPRQVRVADDSPGLAGHPRDFASGCFAPVRADGHVVGAIAALSDTPRDWRPSDVDLLAEVAALAGGAVADWVRTDRHEAGWLRERADDLVTIFASARMGTFDWNVPADSVVVTGGFDEYLSARRGGFAGGLRDWLRLVHPEDRERVDRGLQHAVASGQPYRALYRLLDRDGRGVRWIETRANVLLNAKSVPERVLGVSFDLSEAGFQPPSEGTTGVLHRFNVLDAMRDAVLLSEAEPASEPGPRVVAVNEAFTRMTGYAASDIVGRTPRILQGDRTEPEVRAQIRDALTSWRPLRCRITNYRKTGEPFRVELDLVPIADPTGWYTHWVSVQREILPAAN